MYGYPLKVTESVKFLGVHIDNHLSMKHHIKHIERASLISKMRIAKLNSVNATLLIRLYKIFTRPYMDYACTALTQLSKLQRHKLEVIQNRCIRYARRTVDCTCISNSELRSRNIVSMEQCILALADSWWKKASKNNGDIIDFIYHHQTSNKSKTPLNVIKGNKFF